MQVLTILDQIDLGAIALPEFQRGYVWNRDQVRGLMQSLYRRYPVGSLLVWVTETEGAAAKGDAPLAPGYVKLLLDGQQRVTSLYGILRGNPPAFFQGSVATLTGLHFNVEEETFEFYAPVKMKDNPAWINVTKLMQEGPGALITHFASNEQYKEQLPTYLGRVADLYGIRDIHFHVEEVAGPDKTVDVVVDIFNRVNTGGTKLSKGDLALAKVCAAWPDARNHMNACLKKWRDAGFDFRLDWLLRNTNTILTGEAMFSALKDVSVPAFQGGLHDAEKAVDTLLNLIGSRLGMDHDRVLGGRYALPVMSRYVSKRGGKITDHKERDRLLYWYVHSFLWGRYAGSTESIMNQDLKAIEPLDGGLDRLIGHLRQSRADLHIHPEDFAGWSLGARFYPLLYLLTRTCGAKDFCTGVTLSSHLLGKLSRLELHHVFPKAYLYKQGYELTDVNAIANFAFLTKECNLAISDTPPDEYLAKVAADQPGALESQWIPADPELWKPENYLAFLAERRKLLAAAANELLDGLLAGGIPESEAVYDVATAHALPTGGIGGEEEEFAILDLLEWVEERGLPLPQLGYELADADTGALLAVIDVAWPDGLQEGLSQPVAVLLEEPDFVQSTVNQAGYLYFTSVEAFKEYAASEVLAAGAPAA